MKEKLKEQLKDYQCNIINEKIRVLDELNDKEKDNCYLMVSHILEKEENIGKLGAPTIIAGSVIWMANLTRGMTQEKTRRLVNCAPVSLRRCAKKIRKVLGLKLIKRSGTCYYEIKQPLRRKGA